MQGEYIALEQQVFAKELHASMRGQQAMSKEFGEPINILQQQRSQFSTLEGLVSYTLDGCFFGEAYYLAAPIATMLLRAAETIPRDTKIDADMLPTTSGFLWLEEAFPALARIDRPCVAISWHREPVVDSDGALVFFGVYTTQPGLKAPVLTMVYSTRVGEDLAYYTDIGAMNQSAKLQSEEIRRRGRHPIDYIQIVPFIIAFLLFIRQRLLRVTTSDKLDRATFRRLQKLKDFSWQTRTVQVIRLRKVDYHNTERPAGMSPVEWSCHWITRGHWRRQFYPRRNTHETIWIEAHLRGDLAKPFKPPDINLYAVTR